MQRRLLLLTMIALLAGCGQSASPSSAPANPPVLSPQGKIKHVVLIIQENRSFDVLFGSFPGANGATSGLTNTGAVVPITPITLEDGKDIDHSHQAFVNAYDSGKMDGFNNVGLSPTGVPGVYPVIAGTYPYAQIETSEVQPYWTLAHTYTLADNMFSTETSGSFTAHQDLIAGVAGPVQSGGVLVDYPSSIPWGCDAPAGTTTSVLSPNGTVSSGGPFPCMSYATIAQNLDTAGISWKYYAPTVDSGPPFTHIGGDVWSAYDAIDYVRHGSDWTRNISSPETNVFTDLQNNALPSVSWVIPDFQNSDHSASKSNTGPSWVSSVVNAVGQSSYWNSTAIVIVWDEWGGWYDHVPPPQLDFAGLGFRVPMIVVSPYARRGYISHTQYEFGSILKFVEQAFGLPSLGTSDARANSIDDCFDFTAQPAAFSVVQSRLRLHDLLSRPPSHHLVDSE